MHKKNQEEEKLVTFQEEKVIKKVYNQEKTLLLVLEYKVDGNLPTIFKYKVIDVKTKEVKKEGIFVGVKIEWYDNESLRCFVHKGIIEKTDNDLSKEKEVRNDYIIIKIK
ncbi:MAG: hypothetical protein ABJH82_09605 [Polaribacter sp.]|uniref:hypothetical protein n=1 Tax=Polaribacter sp. TaxID=1920175 RepID=UPI0032655F9A